VLFEQHWQEADNDPNIKIQMPLEMAFLIAHTAALQVKEM
jgi:hypothetical protein